MFALFFWLGMGRNRPKMIIFGPKLPKTHILGKIWPFMVVSKSFGTHITKKHLGNLFALIFWSGIGSYGPKMPIYDQKCQFWAQLGRLEAKNQFLGMEKNFWYPHIRKPMRHLFRVENIDRYGSYWPQGTKMCNFDPKIWIFGAKSHFFVLELRYLSTGHITSMPRATTFTFTFSFRAMGHFSGLTPVFGLFGPFPLRYNSLRSSRT